MEASHKCNASGIQRYFCIGWIGSIELLSGYITVFDDAVSITWLNKFSGPSRSGAEFAGTRSWHHTFHLSLCRNAGKSCGRRCHGSSRCVREHNQNRETAPKRTFPRLRVCRSNSLDCTVLAWHDYHNLFLSLPQPRGLSNSGPSQPNSPTPRRTERECRGPKQAMVR